MAYFLLILSLTVLYVRPGDMFPEIFRWSLLEPLCGLTILAVAFPWVAGLRKYSWSHHLTWILLVWFGFTFSHVWNAYLAAMVATFLHFLPNVFFVFAAFFVLNSKKRLQGFAMIWVLLSVFLALDGVFQYINGIGWGGQEMIQGRIRGVGIFGDPNDLALALVIAIPLAHARFFQKRPIPSKIVFFLFLTLFIYALFLTNSRGGFLSLLVVVYGLLSHRLGPKLRVVGGSLIVLALVFLGPSRLNQMDSSETSAQGRIVAWAEGLQMLRHHPVGGVGYMNFLDYHERTSHNSFVHALAETGLVGTFFWIGVLYFSFLGLRRLSILKSENKEVLWFTYWGKDTKIALMGFLTAALFLTRTYNIVLYLLIGFSAALYNVAHQEGFVEKISPRKKDLKRILGIEFLGIIITYIVVRTLAIWTGQFY